ncbi:MAG: hypothetical protein R6V58_15145, partial [Planctomycetota bacterium]
LKIETFSRWRAAYMVEAKELPWEQPEVVWLALQRCFSWLPAVRQPGAMAGQAEMPAPPARVRGIGGADIPVCHHTGEEFRTVFLARALRPSACDSVALSCYAV